MHTLDPTQIDELEPPPCLFPDVPIGKKKRFFPTDSMDSTNVSFKDQQIELQKSLNDPDTFEPNLISPALSDQMFPTEQPPVTPRPQRSAKTAANTGILLSVRPKRKSRKCSSPRDNNQRQLDCDLNISNTGPTLVNVSDNECEAIIDINDMGN